MSDRRCPEAVIADVGSQVGVVIQCGRDGGHEGNHTATTERHHAEWPRIENEPRQWPDEPAPF